MLKKFKKVFQMFLFVVFLFGAWTAAIICGTIYIATH